MTQSPRPRTPSKQDNAKILLSTLKMTTTIGAVSLSLAGWGLLSRAEALNTAQAVQASPAAFAGSAKNAFIGSSSARSVDVSPGESSRGDTPAFAIAAVKGLATPTSPLPTLTATALPVATVPAATVAGVRSLSVAPPPAPAQPLAPATTRPTATLPASTATSASTDTPAPTDTPTPAAIATTKFKLDVVQWLQTNSGDSVAVVRDNHGVLWYVWGSDVPRIEQGFTPQYEPVPVNGVSRSRHS